MWKDLTMSQRADMMDLYLSKGITSLDDMRSLYDSSISDTARGTSFSDGGSIHIKPENRGKFTALKERTGHSATWFKEHGTPAQKKMATFALNARHWKHGYGSNLYDDGGPKYKKSKSPYYDPETDTVYAPDSVGEFYQHEYFHARPDNEFLKSISQYYENLNDDRLTQMGADLPFVKRFENDPGHFYSPEEIGARVAASRYMLKQAGVKNIDNSFLNNARKNEMMYGENFRDLLHMYNNDNLIGIFKGNYANGGHIYDGTTEDSQQMNTPRYRKLLDAEIKEELSDNDVMELPLAAELSDVRVTGKKKRNVLSQIEEKWVKNDKGEEVPTYWGYNPDTKQLEQLYRLEDGKSADESVFFTPDGGWSYNVPQAAEMRKAHEQWVKNGANANGLDEVMVGTLGLSLTPIALPEIAAGVTAASDVVANAVAATPWGQTAIEALSTPLGKTAINTLLAYPGLNNFFSSEGYQKTANAFNEGRYGDAALSAVGDALDLSMAAPLAKNAFTAGDYISDAIKNLYRNYPIRNYNIDAIIKSDFYNEVSKQYGKDFADDLAQRLTSKEFRKYLFGDNPRKALSNPTVSGTPQITAENAASMTPEQWTAAQDAADDAYYLLKQPASSERFQINKGVYDEEIPEEVKQIYRNAVLPRMLRAHPDYYPLQELYKEGVEKALSKGYTVYPQEVFDSAGKRAAGAAGLTFSDGHIAVREGYEDFALGHELRHRLQLSSSPSMQELKLLNDAYDANFENLGREYPHLKDINLSMERETLNYDARRSLVGDDVLKEFDLDTQNAIIDDMSDTDVFEAVEDADAYGSAFIDFLRKNNLLTHKKAQQFREAMKHASSVATPIAVGLTAAGIASKTSDKK